MFEEKHKEALGVINAYIPDDPTRKKPITPHLLRIGKYLYDNDYSEDVVNAGLLHDMLEWSEFSQKALLESFGPHVRDIVLANTKDRMIEDAAERRADYINRCAVVGEDALIVKAADVLDSYEFYTQADKEPEVARCRELARLILAALSESHKDPIFTKLRSIV